MGKRKDEVADQLGTFVYRKYEDAKQFKGAKTFNVLQTCIDMVRGDAIQELDAQLDCGITMNIAAPIARGIIAMLRDVYAQNADLPFVLTPAPIVELTDATKVELERQLVAQADSLLASVGYQQDALDAQVKNMKGTMLEMEKKQAATAAENLTPVVQARLIEAEWSKAFEHEALQHFVMFPTLIVKCPIYKMRKVKDWNGNRYDVREEKTVGIETINPFNFYPSPDATSAQDAEYLIERRRISALELQQLAALPGFDTEGIEKVFIENPDGHLEDYENGASTEADITGSVENVSLDDQALEGFYDAIVYYGSVPGSKLKHFGIEGVDDRSIYEAELWCIDRIIIKALLNPDLLGRRPFYSASFEPIPNSFWGECPMTRIVDQQRMCTSAIAHLIRNMSFASGPLIERELNRLADDEAVGETLSPYTVVDVKPSLGGAGAVHRFIDTNSHMNELFALFDKAKNEAYEAIGIPKMLFGGTEGMGTIGRTAGGIGAMYAQSSKSIKYAMLLLEERIVEPVIQRIVDDILATTDDVTLKGDIRVRAQGTSGIVDKSQKQEQMNWALQSLVPLMQIKDEAGKTIIPPEAPIRLLYEQFKSMGIPTEGIFPVDYDKQHAVAQDAQQQAPSVVAQPQLDGRSSNAVNTIQQIDQGPMPTQTDFGAGQ